MSTDVLTGPDTLTPEPPGDATGPGGTGRAARLRALLRRLSQPGTATVVVVLGVLGLVVRHGWLSTRPLSSGDWKWPSAGRILDWTPWPSVWTDTLGFGGQNRFLDAFRFPVYAVNGLLASAGATWTFIEKAVYFVPFAVLLPVAGWLLAREVLGSTRWALLAPVLLWGNTYFLLESNGEIPLVTAEALSCCALVLFLRAMRRQSVPWAVGAGLATAATCAMDLRPAYLTVLLAGGYVVVLALVEPGVRVLIRRLGLAGLAGGTFLAIQAFWILPLKFYSGTPAFPTPKAPDFTIITLAHGLAGVDAGWTGGTPAAFVQAPLDPLYLLVPLVALLPLARRRMRPEIVWLALVALVCAFLAKTDNAPLGGVYDFLYSKFPGFSLFREGSKFFYPVALAYAVLVPAALQALAEHRRSASRRLAAIGRVGAPALLALVVVISGLGVWALEAGSLGSTTTPVAAPPVFTDMASLLGADPQRGPVLWIGGPAYSTGNTGEQDLHSYTIASAAHPLDVLSGQAINTVVQSRDALQYYCPVVTEAFCYIQPGLFPYLTRMVGAAYVVSPLDTDIGALPQGVTRAWLRTQLTDMFGAPRIVGTGTQRVLAWRLTHSAQAVESYPAVALVDSGPWSLGALLPALEATGLPAVYRQSFDVSDYPPAPAGVADSVAVMPRQAGGCATTSPSSVGVMAMTGAAAVPVTVGGAARSLPLLARSAALPGWGVYGPVTVAAGQTAITPGTGGPTLGPCVGWSPLAARSFGVTPQPAGPVRTGSNGEQLSTRLVAASGPWTELRRTFDPGWHLSASGAPGSTRTGRTLAGVRPTVVGDGLFNLYHATTTVPAGGTLRVTYSTRKWEDRGLALSALALVLAVAGLVVAARRERRRPPRPPAAAVEVRGDAARWVAIGGLAALVLTVAASAASWYGLPSRATWLGVTANPYGLDLTFGGVAVGLLLLSLAVRVVESLVRGRRSVPTGPPALAPAPTRPRVRRLGALVGTSALLAVAVSSCGTAALGTGGSQALLGAEQAGTTPNNVVGASLDEARVELAARNARLCVEDYTAALRTYHDLASAYAGRARCYQSRVDNASAAVHDWDRALVLSPDNPLYLLGRAAAHRRVGSVTAATKDYESAVEAPQSTADIGLTAVDDVLGLDDPAAARRVVALFSQRYPGDARTLLAAADVAGADDQPSAVDADLTSARTEAAASGNTDEMASALSRTCGHDLITHAYEQAAAICPQAAVTGEDGSGAFDNAAAAEAALGDIGAAIGELSSAIGAFEGNTGPNAQPSGVDGFGLAYLLEAQGRLEVEAHARAAALADYDGALAALPPRTPDFRARLRSDIHAAQRSS